MKGDYIMRFSFEESELLNNFFETSVELTKPEVITKLEEAKANTINPDLVEIANSTIQKINSLDAKGFIKVFSDFPLNNYTVY